MSVQSTSHFSYKSMFWSPKLGEKPIILYIFEAQFSVFGDPLADISGTIFVMIFL